MRRSGFTLLEVLVALAVIAVALGALVKSGGSAAGATAYLRDKTLADWVAMNRIAEYRIGRDWPGIGVRRGSQTLGPHEWFWTASVSRTADRDVRRLDVSVSAREGALEGPVVSLIAYLARPPGAQGGR